MALEKIVKLIESEIENYEFANDITLKNNQIATELAVDPSEVSRFRCGEKSLHLDKIIKLIRLLCPEKETSIMREICLLSLETGKPYIIREAMEYASTARLLDVLNEIVSDQLKHGNKENKELAKVYAIALKYQEKRGNFDELLVKIDQTNTSRFYPKLLKMLIKCAILHYKKEFVHMRRVLKTAETLLNEIYNDDDFILRSYKTRLIEIKAIISLNVLCDLSKARSLAYQVIGSEICAVFKIHSYYILGTSYLLDDYDKCIYFYKLYHNMLELNGMEASARIVREQDMIFAKIVHGRELENIYTNDPSEMAHLYARRGDKEKALAYLDESIKKQGGSIYKDYYRALAYNDPMMLYKSLVSFISCGLKFYAMLVKRDLENISEEWGQIAEIALENFKI